MKIFPQNAQNTQKHHRMKIATNARMTDQTIRAFVAICFLFQIEIRLVCDYIDLFE